MDQFFVRYESRAALIKAYHKKTLSIIPTHPELPEWLQSFQQPGYNFLFFPNADTCWLNPDSYQKLFDLRGYKLEDLPGYDKAEESAQSWLKSQTSFIDRYSPSNSVPMDETPRLLSTWLERLDETSAALFEEPGFSIITDACLRKDEAVFLEIARVISNRQRRVDLDLLDVQTAACWTKCLLWLMTNADARTCIRMHVRFEKPGDPSVKYDAYTKMRQGMNLYQHPKPPLRISRDGSILGLEKFLASLSNVKR